MPLAIVMRPFAITVPLIITPGGQQHSYMQD
jgi:hypothetical protein